MEGEKLGISCGPSDFAFAKEDQATRKDAINSMIGGAVGNADERNWRVGNVQPLGEAISFAVRTRKLERYFGWPALPALCL